MWCCYAIDKKRSGMVRVYALTAAGRDTGPSTRLYSRMLWRVVRLLTSMPGGRPAHAAFVGAKKVSV